MVQRVFRILEEIIWNKVLESLKNMKKKSRNVKTDG